MKKKEICMRVVASFYLVVENCWGGCVQCVWGVWWWFGAFVSTRFIFSYLATMLLTMGF